MGGFSAGGNMALAASQVEGLRGGIGAVVGFYPVVGLDADNRATAKGQTTDCAAGYAGEYVALV